MEIIIIWNIITAIIYGIDKRKAVKHGRRIKESVLIGCAFCMGAAGAAAGMFVFRHKTRKLKFKICIPAALIFNILIMYIYFRFMA